MYFLEDLDEEEYEIAIKVRIQYFDMFRTKRFRLDVSNETFLGDFQTMCC